MGSNVWKIITRRYNPPRPTDRFFWFYSRHKTVPPAIFYLLVINRFLKPNRISPYLSRRIYPVVLLHVRTNTYTGPPMVMTWKQRIYFPIHNSTAGRFGIGRFPIIMNSFYEGILVRNVNKINEFRRDVLIIYIIPIYKQMLIL